MPDETIIEEPARQLPVVGNYDVVVAGGGMAGVAAALAAARLGVRVSLVERYCALGGLATLGNVTMWLPLCDGKGKQVVSGLGQELLQLAVADLKQDYPAARFRRIPSCWQPEGDREQRLTTRYRVDFNPAAYMLALEKLVVEADVDLLYDTRVCAVARDDQRVSHLIVENKSGRAALACQTVVDATGDADVCALAGEKTVSLDSNVISGWFYTLTHGELTLHQLSNRYSPKAEKRDADGPFFRGDDAVQLTDQILQTRRKVRKRLADIRAQQPGDDTQLLMPATMACFRMTRRLDSAFALGEEHVHQWFADTIGLTGDWRKPGPVYAIPISCLRAVGNHNLLVAGRCISVDNTAWDVLRAIPPCVVTGEAAGTAASLAALHTNGDVHALRYGSLRDQLQRQGVLLDPALVARSSTVSMDRKPNKPDARDGS
ncbi:MAG: FAD-dependent oxidoreductase [Planctomycetota bacterium]